MIRSQIHFLKRQDIYDTEKPYTLRFLPPEGFLRANISLEQHSIEIQDIRNETPLEFERDGVAILNLPSQMSYEDYDDEQKVKEVFLKEVANALKAHLQAQHVQVYEHTIRKRHEVFPVSTGGAYEYNQPTSMAHIDTTDDWALEMAEQLNPQRFPQIKKHRVQSVNLWKPIKGPVQDWPLALCRSDSLNLDTEVEACDLVYAQYVVENRQVYHSDKQQWFYLSHQMPNEAWLFLQADTNSDSKPIAHSAFPIPDVGPGDVPPRESIEVRALVFYGGFYDE